MEYSKMSALEWDQHVKEQQRKLKLSDGMLDSNAVVFHGNISVMDSSAPKELSPREVYILSLSAPPQQESVLTQSYRERNQRAALGGLMAYIPDTGEGSPEN